MYWSQFVINWGNRQPGLWVLNRAILNELSRDKSNSFYVKSFLEHVYDIVVVESFILHKYILPKL